MHNANQHGCYHHIDAGTDQQRQHNTHGHIPLGVSGFRRRSRDCFKPDIGKKDNGCRPKNTGDAIAEPTLIRWDKRCPVSRMHLPDAQSHKNRQHTYFKHNNKGVDFKGFTHPQNQQGCHRQNRHGPQQITLPVSRHVPVSPLIDDLKSCRVQSSRNVHAQIFQQTCRITRKTCRHPGA